MSSSFSMPTKPAASLIAIACLSLASADAFSSELRVLDAAGNALHDVAVHWIHDHHTQELLSESGVFQLPQPSGVVVARADGDNYTGLILDKAAAKFTIRLPRHGSASQRAYQTPQRPMDPGVKRQLEEVIKAKCWEVAKATPPSDVLPRAFQLLGLLDPDETIRYLDDHRVNQNANGLARQSVVRQLVHEDVSTALEMLDSFKQPMFRAFMIGEVIRGLPTDHASLGVIEARMADTIREIDQPAYRLASWAVLAEHFALKGEQAKVRTIVEQHLDEVRKLPSGGWTGFPRSLFAALIIDDQPDVALEMIAGIDAGHEKARALGRLAFYSTDPERSRSLLEKIDRGQTIGYPFVTRAAYKLAADHPEAALQIASSIEDAKHRAWARGLVGKRLGETNPEVAKRALDGAIEDIEEACQAKVRTHVSPGEVAAGLLPFVEAVDSRRLEAMLWRSVWATVPHSRWSDGSDRFAVQLENVAAAIARYDQRLATALCPDLEETDYTETVFSRFDARAAVNWIVLDPQALPDFLATQEFNSQTYRGFEAIAAALMAEESEFWDVVSKPSLLQLPTERFEEF